MFKTSQKSAGRSTILIVDANQTKSLSLNTKLIYAIKPALVILTLLSLVLAGLFGYFFMRYTQSLSQAQALSQEVQHLKNATSAEIEAKISELNRSKRAIVGLQAYLKERGVEVDPVSFAKEQTGANDAAGGPKIALSKPIPFIGDFSEQTAELIAEAQKVPLGLPHDGELSSRFGYRHNPFHGRGSEFHGGLDFRGKTGEPIHVTAKGKVSFAGWQRGYGNIVIVAHAHGYETRYAHLSAIDVSVGDKLEVGDVVGKLGSTGRSTGPHLHYEVRQGGERLDPEGFLNIG